LNRQDYQRIALFLQPYNSIFLPFLATFWNEKVQQIFKLQKIIVGHLALYYLESLISIEDELLVCSDGPYGNKRRLLFKFSEELGY